MPKTSIQPEVVNQESHWKGSLSEGREGDSRHSSGKAASGLTPILREWGASFPETESSEQQRHLWRGLRFTDLSPPWCQTTLLLHSCWPASSQATPDHRAPANTP